MGGCLRGVGRGGEGFATLKKMAGGGMFRALGSVRLLRSFAMPACVYACAGA